MVVKRVLVIDDEKNILLTIKESLEDEGYVVETASSASAGLLAVQKCAPDVVFLDIWLPDGDGVAVLEKILKLDPSIEVIMMSGHGTVENAVRAIKIGAFDFLEKPLHFEKLELLLRHAMELKELKRENRYLREELEEEERIISSSPTMAKLEELIRSVAPSSAWVMVRGENGTGKELVARAIHSQSDRRHRPFVPFRTGRLRESDVKEILLGGAKGSAGKLSEADGGTLFLQNIDGASVATQQAVLACLEQTEHDVRVIGSVASDISDKIGSQFDRDLYLRLSVIPVPVPALRDRTEDLAALVERFIERYSIGRAPELNEAVMEVLRGYHWPGNVRELKNWVERACILTRSGLTEITEDLFERELALAGTEENWRSARAAFEKHFLQRMLAEHSGNVSKTAQKIGLERSYLHKKMKSYGIEV